MRGNVITAAEILGKQYIPRVSQRTGPRGLYYRSYYIRNRERIREYSYKNRERIRANSRKWYEENRERHNEARRKRRANARRLGLRYW